MFGTGSQDAVVMCIQSSQDSFRLRLSLSA